MGVEVEISCVVYSEPTAEVRKTERIMDDNDCTVFLTLGLQGRDSPNPGMFFETCAHFSFMYCLA
jgi:hypothetical protein